MTPENKYRGNGKVVYKEALQDKRRQMLCKRSYIGAQLTTERVLSRVTREQEFDIQELALFLRDRLHKGLYCGRKGKRYATEVVSNEKLLPNGFEGRLRQRVEPVG